MPIERGQWEENFEATEDGMMEEEDTPGFTLVVASAALGMALFVNQRRETKPTSESPPSAREQDLPHNVDPAPRKR